MYLEHFGLREAPFRITPHTEFFFAGAARGITLEALIYAITHDEGIVKVSGEVGSGKTMLCRMLLEKLPDRVETVYLSNPSLSREEIFYAIAEELRAPLPEGRIRLLLRSLQDRLLEIYAAGRQVVILIDEAHAMPPETLEEIRLLSNLESNRQKLLQIVLFGQPELDDRLRQTNMRQLRERITHNFALEPLQRKDIAGYLMFRMRAAGYRGPDLFTAKAVQLISQSSDGLTRRINMLADKALLSAFSENRHQIGCKQVKAAIRDAQFKPMHGPPSPHWRWLGTTAAVASIAGAAFVLGNHKTTAEAPPPPVASAPPISSTPTLPAPVSRSVPAANALPHVPHASLAERIAATDGWLESTPESHFFIQLFSTEAGKQSEVESFIESIVQSLDIQKIRIYRSTLSGRDKIGVIYGDYPSRNAANAALSGLPESVRRTGVYLRTVRKLRPAQPGK
ncbi:MAG: AAA family ATPase [Rhodocyclaceae bacterium]